MPLCIGRNIRIVNGRAYHPQSQGAIEQANKVCKVRLYAAQSADTGEANPSVWVIYLPQVARVVNTIRPISLPAGVTPYEAWYGRPFPIWPEMDVRRRALRALSSPVLGEELPLIVLGEEPETSDSEQEDNPEEEVHILSTLSKRIAEFSVRVRERMILKKGGKGLQYRVGEIATLFIPKKYRVGVEAARCVVRIISKVKSVSEPPPLLVLYANILLGLCGEHCLWPADWHTPTFRA